MIALPIFMPRDWLTRGPRAVPSDDELVARLPAFLEEGAQSALAGGLAGLRQSMREELQRLSDAFATWAPGLLGNPTLDPVLSAVPELTAKGWALDTALLGVAAFHTAEDLAAPDPDAHARQVAAAALDDYLSAFREFERVVGVYRSRVSPSVSRTAENPAQLGDTGSPP